MSTGEWFSQRTSHHLAFRQAESGKSNIAIAPVKKEDPEVIQLCKMYQIDPNLALDGARVTWEGTMEWDEDKENHSGTTLLVPVPDPVQPQQGQMLRDMGYAEKAPVAGRYSIGSDGALILITEYETMYSEERLWFASPNLRLRHSILKRFGGFSMASFCSEVRMGVGKPTNNSSQ